MKICTNELGHLTYMAAMPIFGKNLKNFFLQNQKTNDRKTWNGASCMGVLPRLFKL